VIDGGAECGAFPHEIPMNKHDSCKPYLGDCGIHFEPIIESKPVATATPDEPRKSRRRRNSR